MRHGTDGRPRLRRRRVTPRTEMRLCSTPWIGLTRRSRFRGRSSMRGSSTSESSTWEERYRVIHSGSRPIRRRSKGVAVIPHAEAAELEGVARDRTIESRPTPVIMASRGYESSVRRRRARSRRPGSTPPRRPLWAQPNPEVGFGSAPRRELPRIEARVRSVRRGPQLLRRHAIAAAHRSVLGAGPTVPRAVADASGGPAVVVRHEVGHLVGRVVGRGPGLGVVEPGPRESGLADSSTAPPWDRSGRLAPGPAGADGVRSSNGSITSMRPQPGGAAPAPQNSARTGRRSTPPRCAR